MTDDELQAIRQRCEQATAAPWFLWSSSGDISSEPEDCAIFMSLRRMKWPGDGEGEDHCSPQGELDCVFVANARSDVPRLLDEVERLRTENAEKSGVITRLSKRVDEKNNCWERLRTWARERDKEMPFDVTTYGFMLNEMARLESEGTDGDS